LLNAPAGELFTRDYRMTTPNQSTQSPGAHDKVDAILREFTEEKVRERNEERARNRPRKSHNGVKLAIMSIACLTVWVGPEFIAVIPTRPAEQVLRRGVQTQLFLDGQQLQAYREKHGQLPSHLAAAGVDDTTVSYIRQSDSTFRLTASFNGEVLAVDSEDNADSVLVGLPLARGR
jgi:hypothetical protein